MENQKILFQEILDSEGGQHLSVYLKNDERVLERFVGEIQQIRETLIENEPQEFVDAFLNPLESHFMKSFDEYSEHETIAIFRRDDYIKVIGLATENETFHVLSSTFHVKPLLSWKQSQFYGTLVYSTAEKVQLISISTTSVKKIFEVRHHNFMGEESDTIANMNGKLSVHSQQKLIYWLKLIFENKKLSLPDPVVVYGYPMVSEFCSDAISHLENREVLWSQFTLEPELGEALALAIPKIRKENILRQKRFRRDFIDLKADEYLSYDWSEIIEAIRDGRAKSVMIASDVRVFGKIDKFSGQYQITHTHTDAEDDDLLDDISQLAIKNGAKVLFYEASQLPRSGRRLIKAILKKDEEGLGEIGGAA